MEAVLEARNVTKVFGRTKGLGRRPATIALQDFSIGIGSERPTIIAIAGESGSGKTTLARLLLGIISPSEGEVLYQGRLLNQMSGTEWRAFRQQVQAIFQDPFGVYNPFYKVDHLLTTPIAKFGLAKSRRERRALMEQALHGVGLRPEETLGRYPHQLSGGQRQRLTIARALLLNPRIIIADEPVSMIDASLRATILESLMTLYKEHDISLLYVTHDLTTAYQVCEKIVALYRGRVAEVGDVEAVIKDPKHPYTQLLVGSIPLPNPDLPWGAVQDSRRSEAGDSRDGCLFADRCPHVMGICRRVRPPLFRTQPSRAAACHLLAEFPQAEATEVLERA